MRNPYQRKAAIKSQNTAYDPLQVYKNFIEAIVAQGGTLPRGLGFMCHADRTACFRDLAKKQGLARLLIKDNWANYQIQEITLKDFVEKVIPFLRQESTIVSLDLTPEGQNILVAPEKLLLDLKTTCIRSMYRNLNYSKIQRSLRQGISV